VLYNEIHEEKVRERNLKGGFKVVATRIPTEVVKTDETPENGLKN